MPEDPNVSSAAPEPLFSLDEYRTERDKPVAPAAEPSEEAEKPPEPAPEPETEDDNQEQPEEQRPKGKGGFQRRIDKLIARQAELERQLAERTAVQPPPVAPAPAAPAGEPKIEAYASYDEYVSALTDWRVENKFREMEAAITKAQAEEAVATQQREFSVKLEAAREKYEDFDDVVSAAPPITVVTRDFILDSAVGTEIMYQLGQHPADAAKLAQLSPITQIKVLHALEARLAPQTPETKPKATTKAPEPIRPIGTSAAPVLTAKPNMTYEEFRAWRLAGGGR